MPYHLPHGSNLEVSRLVGKLTDAVCPECKGYMLVDVVPAGDGVDLTWKCFWCKEEQNIAAELAKGEK